MRSRLSAIDLEVECLCGEWPASISELMRPNRTAMNRKNYAMPNRGQGGAGFWKASRDDAGWKVMLAHGDCRSSI
jgi:hypothetical protein